MNPNLSNKKLKDLKIGKSVYSGKDIPLDTTMDCRKYYRFHNDYYE